jgi:predicted transposase YdaD
MASDQPESMARGRALMTETERENIRGEHSDSRRYESVSRVRARIHDELAADVELLQDHHQELLDELRQVVCEEE